MERKDSAGNKGIRKMRVSKDALEASTDKVMVSAVIKRHKKGLRRDILAFGVKAVAAVAALFAVFVFVFGVYRTTNAYMEPSIKDGDVVMFYRLGKDFAAGDIAVVGYEGRTESARVVAVGGDVIDIDEKGLKVNGAYHSEPDIYFDTTQVEGGVSFPIEVPEGSVFLLGDNRPHAVDSRIFGCVNKDEAFGKVIAIFRRRGF